MSLKDLPKIDNDEQTTIDNEKIDKIIKIYSVYGLVVDKIKDYVLWDTVDGYGFEYEFNDDNVLKRTILYLTHDEEKPINE